MITTWDQAFNELDYLEKNIGDIRAHENYRAQLRMREAVEALRQWMQGIREEAA